MDYTPNEHVLKYVGSLGNAVERRNVNDFLSDFEKQDRKSLSEDEILLPVQGYKNLYEVRFRDASGPHRLIGPIIHGRIYLIHAFLKQGKRQQQREFKTAAERAGAYIKRLE